MIGYLILGVCLLAALLLAANWLANIDPKQLARILVYLVVGVLGAAGLVCLITGRIFFAIPLLFLAATIVRRWRGPMPGFSLGGMRQPASGRASKVETDYLDMTLDHDSGVMAGQVLRGAYAGKNLAELNLEQLIALLGECYRDDPESAQLLETYLDRIVGEDWRDKAQMGEQAGEDAGGGRGWGPKESPQVRMSRDEACEILGVGDNASTDEIKTAYRQLMQKLHPDQGGSTYLAAKINQAKDILLGV